MSVVLWPPYAIDETERPKPLEGKGREKTMSKNVHTLSLTFTKEIAVGAWEPRPMIA